jgi:cytochrome d ubiquinol oxidase subunit I
LNDLIAARSTMALSLGFHIIFACIGMTMPFLMVASHWLYLKKNDEIYLRLTKAWSRGVAIFFAIGAVSGTALSFELGILFPGFMKHAGPIIGMPFSWEGTAFFVESICIGIFLYGWNRINKWVHWTAGLLVGVSGVVSGIFVVCANAWMNAPAGFDWINGQAYNIDPFKAMFNPAWKTQTSHMILAAFEATAFAVGGLHALLYLRNRKREVHRKAIIICLFFGSIFAIIQPFSGDITAKNVAQRQPAKLAAMEAQYHTEKGAPLSIGGLPDDQAQKLKYAIQIPKGLSFLAYGDFNAEVKGLEEFPKENQPPVLPTHLGFQAMVGSGTLLALAGIIFLFTWFTKKELKKWMLWLFVICTPFGFIAVEGGWIVTELGRQPWIIYNIMRTAEAVTPVPYQVLHLLLFTLIYAILTFTGIWLMNRQVNALDKEVDDLRGEEA